MPAKPPRRVNAPSLDAIFAALADPTRRAMVAQLATGEATVLALAAPFDVSLPAVSRHLKVLESAGLITRGRNAQTRPCRLRPEALDEISAWAMHTRRAWEERLDNLSAYLQHLQSATPQPAARPRTPKETHRHARTRR